MANGTGRDGFREGGLTIGDCLGLKGSALFGVRTVTIWGCLWLFWASWVGSVERTEEIGDCLGLLVLPGLGLGRKQKRLGTILGLLGLHGLGLW